MISNSFSFFSFFCGEKIQISNYLWINFCKKKEVEKFESCWKINTNFIILGLSILNIELKPATSNDKYINTSLSNLPSRNEARIQHLSFTLGEYKGGSHTRTWPYTIYQPRKSRKSSFRESKNWLWKRSEKSRNGEIRKKRENRSNKWRPEMALRSKRRGSPP